MVPPCVCMRAGSSASALGFGKGQCSGGGHALLLLVCMRMCKGASCSKASLPPAPHCATLCCAAQGLADTFLLLGMPFDSPEASDLNKVIFETIYHAALQVCVRACAHAGWLGGAWVGA